MPWISFYANFLWVMVLGLIGPSVPAIVMDLGISYSRAGFLFTALSAGSLFGTLFGGIIADRMNRRMVFSVCTAALASGLILFGRSNGYIVLIVFMFMMSLIGSPVGVVGQTIMLDMYPDRGDRFLSYQTFFAALGNCLAPLVVAMNVILRLSWRWSFFETAILGFILFCLAVTIRYPRTGNAEGDRVPVKTILTNSTVIISSIYILFSVAVDIGFSYWLAEYFSSHLHVPLKLASAVVSIYIAGVIFGRLSTPFFLRYARPIRILQISLSFSALVLLFYIFVPTVSLKTVSVFFYGLGIGPLFPLMLFEGTKDYTGQSGSVSGILFSFMSVGGMIFPFMFGALAQIQGIGSTYYVVLGILICMIISLTIWKRERERITRSG